MPKCSHCQAALTKQEAQGATCPSCGSYLDAGRLDYDQSQGTGNQDGGGNPLMGWLIFFLIFGVGNAILYSTTGIFFIPIPRR